MVPSYVRGLGCHLSLGGLSILQIENFHTKLITIPSNCTTVYFILKSNVLECIFLYLICGVLESKVLEIIFINIVILRFRFLNLTSYYYYCYYIVYSLSSSQSSLIFDGVYLISLLHLFFIWISVNI